MLRREFLAASAAGIFFPPGDGPQSSPASNSRPRIERPELGFERVRLKRGVVSKLPPSAVRRIAWTVDDGVSSKSLRQYLDWVEKHDLRMTFFVTAAYSAWRKNRRQLQEMVDDSRVQLANHTFSHPSLTRISNHSIKQELQKCERFIEDTFGVSTKPYFRPPYGRIDSRVIKVARDAGYSAPVMWNGSLGDSISQRRKHILQMGQHWIRDRVILIDHVNDPTPDFVFKGLHQILKQRGLQTVTLDDVYLAKAPKG